MPKKRHQPETSTLVEAYICRVCLLDNKDSKFLSVFELYKEIPIVDHIINIANVVISKDDGMPSKICKCCLLELETALNFKQKCETSDIYLHATASTSEIGCTVKEEEQVSTFNEDVKQEKEDIQYKEDIEDHSIDHVESDFNYDNDNIEESDPQLKNEYDEIRTSVPSGTVQCHDCGEFFKSKFKLRVHWKKTHIPEYICPICKRLFRKMAAFKRHIKSNICSKSNGIRVEGVGKLRKFYCTTCDFTGKHYYVVAKHQVTHTGEKPYKCNLCTSSYTQIGGLTTHKENAHQEIRVEMTCHFCGKLIRGRRKIYSHLRTHSKDRFQCDHCKIILKSKSNLIMHLKRHGEKSVACEICAKLFFTSMDLANHRKIAHTYTLYKCKTCGYKKLRTLKALKKHEVNHFVYDFYCTTCGKFFSTVVRLALHKQSEHVGRKPVDYCCPLCSKTSISIDRIRRHMKEKHSKEYHGPGEMPEPGWPHTTTKKKNLSLLRSKKTTIVEVETDDE